MVIPGGSELLQEFNIYVLDVPEHLQDETGSSQTFALVILRRQSGALSLCLQES